MSCRASRGAARPRDRSRRPSRASLPIPVRKPFSRRRRQGFLLVIVVAPGRGRRRGDRGRDVVVAAAGAAGDDPQEDRKRRSRCSRAAAAVGFTPAARQASARSRTSRPGGANRPPDATCSRSARRRRRSRCGRPPGRRSASPLRGRPCCSSSSPTWCPHCAAEAPHLKALADTLPARSYALRLGQRRRRGRGERPRLPRLLRAAVPGARRPEPATRGSSPTTARPGRSRRPTASALPDLLRDRPARAGSPGAPTASSPTRCCGRSSSAPPASSAHRAREPGSRHRLYRFRMPGGTRRLRARARRSSAPPTRRCAGEPAPDRAALPRLLAQALGRLRADRRLVAASACPAFLLRDISRHRDPARRATCSCSPCSRGGMIAISLVTGVDRRRPVATSRRRSARA